MTQRPAPTSPPATVLGLPVLLAVLLALNVLPELALSLADRGIGLPPAARGLAFRLGAFQPDLMAAPGPVFPGQSLAMFVTYGFLHTGPGHLAANMAGLFLLGRLILSYRTSETFFTLYFMSMIGAAEVFVLTHSPGSTVVGASGALFGLFGVYAVDQGLFTPRGDVARPGLIQLTRLALATGAVVVSDVAGQAVLGTPVAWQAHAGGFVTGAVMALIAPPRFRHPS